jgi:hypothetical protein
VDVGNLLPGTVQPNSQVEDGNCHALRPHHAFEGRGLAAPPQGKVEAR